MENVRNRANMKILREDQEEKQLLQSIAKPSYHRSITFDHGLVAVEFARMKVKLNKPIYVGTSVLDLSKELMFSFYYDVLYPHYGDKLKLLYTDTDSLILLIETDDIVEDMKQQQDQYDTSNYPVNHPLFSTVNKKVVGKFKDEAAGKTIREFVGLRSKMYAYDCEGGDLCKKAKGVQSSVLSSPSITLGHYREQLREEVLPKICEMSQLRHRKHHIYHEKMTKISLSGFDSKRYILDNGVDTLAFGHTRLKTS